VGAIAGAAIGAYAQLRTQRAHARREAEAVLARYREPLLAAVVDLQWSIHNILGRQFLWRLVHENDGGRRDVALASTVFNFAQYFGWREVLRLESQLIEFEEVDETRAVSRLLSDVTSRLSAMEPTDDESFRLFKAEQRAIGELMLMEHAGNTVCVGYAAFRRERRELAAEWLDRLEDDLCALAGTESPDHPRLRDVQHRLVDLAVRLDSRGVRGLSETLRRV